jgi:hypothetical protein
MTAPEIDARPLPAGFKLRVLLVASLALVAGGVVFSFPPIPQDPSYHHFADGRTTLGVPNFWNVISNAPFLLVGAAGAWFVLDRRRSRLALITAGECCAYLFLFVGVALTAFGSGYYHLAPDNPRLVWDRLPLAVAFMGLFSAVIAERINLKLGVGLLVPLVAAGIGSVLYWGEYDDLRPYLLVQFFPLAAIPLMLLIFPPRYSGTVYFFVALGCYLLAKWFETFDRKVYEALAGQVSGHTIKHLLAGLGTYFLLHMLWRRQAPV